MERLKEFDFDVHEKTLQNDLKELKNTGAIQVKVLKQIQEQGQYKSQRHISQNEGLINTFMRVEVLMDSFSYFFKRIYLIVSNKLKSAKTYLQKGIERINKVFAMRRQKEQNRNRKPMDLGEVVSYFMEKLRKPGSEAEKFFRWYSKKNWCDSGGKPIISWQGIAQVWG